jgi:glycerol-3-phosphate dehydrogenase (NAD(P)+)
MKTNHVSVLGAGAWGQALARAFQRAGREVTLWGRDVSRLAAMDNIRLTGDLAQVIHAPVFVLAVPAQALRQVAEGLGAILPPGRALVSAAKGIERQTGLFTTEVMADAMGMAAHRYGVLSGPSFAVDVSAGLPTAIVLAMLDGLEAQALSAFLGSPGFRLYHSQDVRGVEIGGAAKNVLAIAAGIVTGLKLGESARAAIIARGFAELRRFAAGYGAKPETLMGLSGLGDLLLTASSPQSRNFAYGLALGQGAERPEKLAEGAFTAAILNEMARARNVDMPIVASVTAILAGQVSVAEAVQGLMTRPFREE